MAHPSSSHRYPNATAMIDTLHDMNIRVIFWITSMVDTDSPNFQQGYDSNYYIKDAFGKPGKMNWWHGTGCLIDYTNPEALQWWHSQMDLMLARNIDGMSNCIAAASDHMASCRVEV